MTKKTIVIVLCSFLIGAVLGGLGIGIYYGKTIGFTMSFMGLQSRAEWSERAHQAYKNEEPQIAIWALKNLAEVLQKDMDIHTNDKKTIQMDLLLTYGRLAKLYRIKKDEVRYKENILNALNLAHERSSEIKTEEELLEFLEKADSMAN